MADDIPTPSAGVLGAATEFAVVLAKAPSEVDRDPDVGPPAAVTQQITDVHLVVSIFFFHAFIDPHPYCPPKLKKMDIEVAKRLYCELLPSLETKTKEIKDLRKVERRCKAAFKKHMKEHGANSFSVGGKTFSFEKKEKIVVSMDRIEESFPPAQVAKYKDSNKEQVEVFKCSR